MKISVRFLTSLSLLSIATASNTVSYAAEPRDVQSMQRKAVDQRQDQKIQDAHSEQNRLENQRQDQKIQDDHLDQRKLDIQRENQHATDRQLDQRRVEQRRQDNTRDRRLDVAARDHNNNYRDRDDQDLMDETLDERYMNRNQNQMNYNQTQQQQAAYQQPNGNGQSQNPGQSPSMTCQDRNALHKLKDGQKCYEESHKERMHVAEQWEHDHKRD